MLKQAMIDFVTKIVKPCGQPACFGSLAYRETSDWLVIIGAVVPKIELMLLMMAQPRAEPEIGVGWRTLNPLNPLGSRWPRTVHQTATTNYYTANSEERI